MAVEVVLHQDRTATLAATLTRVVFDDASDIAWLTSDGAFVIVYSATASDGDAVPAGRGYPVAAGTHYPALRPADGMRLLVAASSGTPKLGTIGGRS